MLFRSLIAALALTAVATDSEAGPLRRRAQPVYQPSYPSYSYAPPAPVEYVSNYTPAATGDSAAGVVVGSTPGAVVSSIEGDGLDEVNAKRAARGLRPFIRDEGLMQAARSCAAYRAQYGLFGHTSNDFGFVPAGSAASSAGCAAYPAGYGWMSCCTFDNYTYAGAAYVTGRDGRRYMHLFVR
jgi:hypothetical protein